MSEPPEAEGNADAATTGGSSGAESEQPAPPQDKPEEGKPTENGSTVAEGTEQPKAKEDPTPVAPPPKPKYRYDWYQTPTDVYINVMIKGLRNEDVSVCFDEKSVSCCCSAHITNKAVAREPVPALKSMA